MLDLNTEPRSAKRSRDSPESTPPTSHNEGPPSSKKTRTEDHPIHTGHRPPGFWDSLSRVHLTRGALRELGRRQALNTPEPTLVPCNCTELPREAKTHQLERFARHGGPDLSHIRGVSI